MQESLVSVCLRVCPVDLLVRAQVAELREALAADGAAEGSLSGVDAPVHLQVAGAVETLPAERTDEPLFLRRFTSARITAIRRRSVLDEV